MVNLTPSVMGLFDSAPFLREIAQFGINKDRVPPLLFYTHGNNRRALSHPCLRTNRKAGR